MYKYFLSSCLVAGALLIAGLSNHAYSSEVIYYPRSTAKIDPHIDFILEVLNAALRQFPNKYLPQPSNEHYPQSRAINETTSPTGRLDLLWTMSTNERENNLIPIRIPLDKGTLGWRISFVTNKKRDLLKQVKTLIDLQKFDAGQVHDWPDTEILQSNNLNVVSSSTYEASFKMLEVNRFDYFPRAIFEIWGELAAHSASPLEVERHIVLHYPTAYYFFVSPRKSAFARDLNSGMERIVADGQFERIFQKYHRESIQKANIKRRTIIELSNPLLDSQKLPFNRQELWFKP
ncbi:hypothetical protein [Undibacterium sp. RuRC25W]|uniref:hypothetical protein n=1 Tax=Undibacterium sp. RuRC25W TaxID=3413047 RepID=UPI003BF2C01A